MNYADLLEEKCPVGVAQLKAAWGNEAGRESSDFIADVSEIGRFILEELGIDEAKMPESVRVWNVLIGTALCRKNKTPDSILTGFGQHLVAREQLGG
jgi:hypothetical protein